MARRRQQKCSPEAVAFKGAGRVTGFGTPVHHKQRLQLSFWPRLVNYEVVMPIIEKIRESRDFDMEVLMTGVSCDRWRS